MLLVLGPQSEKQGSKFLLPHQNPGATWTYLGSSTDGELTTPKVVSSVLDPLIIRTYFLLLS